MTYDPFDRMLRSNPVPSGQAPPPPMAVAERIIGSRRAVPGWMVAAAAAAVVVIAGGSSILWLRGSEPSPVAAGATSSTTVADMSSTSVAEVTTTQVAPVATTQGDLDHRGTVYFFIDTTGESWPGPFLVPVERPVDQPDPITGTVQALIDGPTSAEASAAPAISSAIPAGTRLLGLDVFDGTAIVNLSTEFTSGGGTLSMTGRLAQIVFTLTRFPEIDGVRFEVEGIPTTVFGGEGIIVPDPARRSDFEGLLPAVFVDSPAYADFSGLNPMIVTGSANVFEATVSAALTDGNGLILWEGFTTATCGTGCRGEWELTIPYDVDAPQMGALIVWEASARDGSQTNLREHPVWLVPAGGASSDGSCSGNRVTDPLMDQPELPSVVHQTRAAIFDAATRCDWDLLDSLVPDAFTFSFGGPGNAIEYWQQLEADGSAPMRFLAEMLNRPFVAQTFGEITYYWWPSAFVVPWSDVSETDREALRPLYDDADFAGFADFGGYFGYRVGITGEGAWVVFVAGD